MWDKNGASVVLLYFQETLFIDIVSYFQGAPAPFASAPVIAAPPAPLAAAAAHTPAAAA